MTRICSYIVLKAGKTISFQFDIQLFFLFLLTISVFGIYLNSLIIFLFEPIACLKTSLFT